MSTSALFLAATRHFGAARPSGTLECLTHVRTWRCCTRAGARPEFCVFGYVRDRHFLVIHGSPCTRGSLGAPEVDMGSPGAPPLVRNRCGATHPCGACGGTSFEPNVCDTARRSCLAESLHDDLGVESLTMSGRLFTKSAMALAIETPATQQRLPWVGNPAPLARLSGSLKAEACRQWVSSQEPMLD